MIILEKKVNKTKLYNLKYDLNQRGITFEGADFYANYCKTIVC